LVLPFFTTNRFWEAERRDLAGVYWTIRSDKYFGDLPLIHLKVNIIILNSMRYLIGSQCISLRTCVIWSYLLHNETRRAAEFWILCSLAMSLLGIPMRRLLQLSRIEEIKACTRISVDDLLRNLRTLLIRLRAKDALRHTVFTWLHRESWLSIMSIMGSGDGAPGSSQD